MIEAKLINLILGTDELDDAAFPFVERASVPVSFSVLFLR